MPTQHTSPLTHSHTITHNTHAHRWLGSPLRNFLEPDEIWTAARHAVRISTRLLRAVATELRAGSVAPAAALAPSVCARLGRSYYSQSWCRLDGCWRTGHPSVGAHPKSGVEAFAWGTPLSPGEWERVTKAYEAAAARAAARGRAAPRGQLFHKLAF